MGLPIDRSCPECGLSIAEAIDQLVDPTATALPRLRSPARTGAALFGLTALHLLATLVLCITPLIARFALWRGTSSSLPRWLTLMPLVASLVALLSIIAIWQLSLPRGGEADRRVARYLRLMAFGAFGFGGSVVALYFAEKTVSLFEPRTWSDSTILLVMLIQLAIVLTAALHYHGFGRIVRIIGQRSREYRTSNIGRQRMRDMVVVLLVFGAAQVIDAVALLAELPSLTRIATLASWISILMLLIGQAYLVVNMWWIRRAIRRPIPHLRDLIQMVPLEPNGSAAAT